MNNIIPNVDVGHYKWYQSLDLTKNLADEDVRPSKGGAIAKFLECRGQDEVNCAVSHCLGKVKRNCL